MENEINEEKLKGARFLHKLYPDLYKSNEVMHKFDKKKQPASKINDYMERLDRIHKKALEKNKDLAYLYFDRYIIKEDNINAKDLHGNITKRDIIKAQKDSLKLWLDYLVSDEVNDLPMWARYWAFQGMLRMGNYDSVNEKYFVRKKNTIAPFVSLNHEVALQTIDLMIKYNDGRYLGDDEVEKLLETGSFSKIYGTLLKKYENRKKIQSNPNDGIWIKYNQGSEIDSLKLFESLRGKNTGWCTGVKESYAKKQVCGPYMDAKKGGDFYVYYTKDEDGEYTLPRLAIRMIDDNHIGEIRGISDDQNIEEGLEDIIDSKIKSLEKVNEEERNQALNTVNDLRTLSIIYRKYKMNEKMTKDEIELILSNKNIGFGWANDKRAKELDLLGREIFNYYEGDVAGILNNKEAALKAISQSCTNYDYIPEDIRKDTDIIIEYIKREDKYRRSKRFLETPEGKEFLKSEFGDYKINKDFILKLYDLNYNGLGFASEELRDDEEFVLRTMKKNAAALVFASERIKNNKRIVLTAVSMDGTVLKFASETLKDDEEIVLEGLKNKGETLKFASERLKKNKKLVLMAIEKGAVVIPGELQDDEEVVRLAVEKFGIMHDWHHIIKDKKIILKSLSCAEDLDYVDPELLHDIDFMLAAIDIDPGAAEYMSPDLMNDKGTALKIIKAMPEQYMYLPEEIKNDRDILIEIISNSPSNIENVPEKLKHDIDFIKTLLDRKRNVLYYLDETMKNDPELVIQAVSFDGDFFQYIDDKLKKDRNIVLEAVKNNASNIYLADESFYSDREIMLIAIKNDPYVIFKASNELQNDEEMGIELMESIKNKHNKIDYEYGESLKEGYTKEKNYFDCLSDNLISNQEFLIKCINALQSIELFTILTQKRLSPEKQKEIIEIYIKQQEDLEKKGKAIG